MDGITLAQEVLAYLAEEEIEGRRGSVWKARNSGSPSQAFRKPSVTRRCRVSHLL